MGILRVSRVVQLILEAELEPAKGLGVLVDRVHESGMSRHQFINALLELSSALEHWPGLADQEDEGHARRAAAAAHTRQMQLRGAQEAHWCVKASETGNGLRKTSRCAAAVAAQQRQGR